MRALFVCALAACPLPAAPAAAQDALPPSAFEEALPFEAPMPLDELRPGLPLPAPEAAAPEVTAPAVDPAPTLDSLFADLKREASPERAELIVSRIRAEWLRSGSETVDLLVRWGSEAVRDGNPGAAFDLFEQAMVLKPDYAEAWNARATLNFQLNEYGRSLADVEQTLRREPRHFGALMGLGAILEELGDTDRALRAYRRVLDIYPAYRTAQDAVARLAAEGRGQSL